MRKRFIAENIEFNNDTYTTQLNNNICCIGGSGTGKTGGFCHPYLLSTEESFVIADTKSNLYRNYKKSLENRGYKVYNLNLIEPSKGCGYNPLDYVGKRVYKGKIVYNEKDIISISHALCPVTAKDDVFWQQQAQLIISILISYVLETFDKDKNLASVSDMFKLFCLCVKNKSVPFLEEYCLKYPDSFVSRKYSMISSSFEADRTWSCVQMFLANAFDVFDFDEARDMVSKKSNFKIENLGREKTAVFLNVSDIDRCLDPIINIFYTQCFQVLTREADKQPNSRLPISCNIILDDMCTNCRIEDFDKIISVIRSRNISANLIIQAISQLDSVYSEPQKWTILTNCDTILYLGGTDLATVDYIAKRARKSPDDVMALELGKAYFIQRGMKTAQKVTKIRPYSLTEEDVIETSEEDIFFQSII